MGPASSFYIARRLRLHYLEWGAQDAPPLLLVHGGLDHARSWDPIAEDLACDWRVIAPDLAGHGESAWVSSGNYPIKGFVYDMAQLIHALQLGPLPIVGHSLGGHISIRVAAAQPETVTRLAAIEGLGPAPEEMAKTAARPIGERMRAWIDDSRAIAQRRPRRYASVDDALARMRAANPRLTEALARHLTVHGLRRNEDGSFGWKFDNWLRLLRHEQAPAAELEAVWRSVTCPTLLIYGAESWASDPGLDGRAGHFPDARVERLENAGHWAHHDRIDAVLPMLRAFLSA